MVVGLRPVRANLHFRRVGQHDNSHVVLTTGLQREPDKCGCDIDRGANRGGVGELIRLGNVSKPTIAVYRPEPSKNTGAAVVNSSRHFTLSMSISMMRKFGTAAQKCALIAEARWP